MSFFLNDTVLIPRRSHSKAFFRRTSQTPSPSHSDPTAFKTTIFSIFFPPLPPIPLPTSSNGMKMFHSSECAVHIVHHCNNCFDAVSNCHFRCYALRLCCVNVLLYTSFFFFLYGHSSSIFSLIIIIVLILSHSVSLSLLFPLFVSLLVKVLVCQCLSMSVNVCVSFLKSVCLSA